MVEGAERTDLRERGAPVMGWMCHREATQHPGTD